MPDQTSTPRKREIFTPDNWGPHSGDSAFVLCMVDGVAVPLVSLLPAGVTHFNHIGVSGGKDSDALLAWALFESGYDHRTLIVSFCDTGNEDHYTYEQIEVLRQLCARYGVLFFVVYPGKDFYELVEHKGMFPSRKRRFCTQFLKMEPTRLFCHALVDCDVSVTLHSGVRGDESDDRAKLPERDFDGFFALPIYRPLLQRTIADIIAMHQKYNIPLNKLYTLGAHRVGCFPCINSRKREMRLVATLRPEKIDAIEKAETALFEAMNRTQKGGGTFFHRNTVPLRFRSMDYTTKDGRTIKVATIRDIVNWSMTGKRARGRWQDDEPSLPNFADPGASCIATYGACE